MFIAFGGLDDYIYREPRETLIGWALTAERFDRDGHFLIGGLDDMIGSMTNNDLAKYILDKANKHPELNSSSKLNALAKEYGFSTTVDSVFA